MTLNWLAIKLVAFGELAFVKVGKSSTHTGTNPTLSDVQHQVSSAWQRLFLK